MKLATILSLPLSIFIASCGQAADDAVDIDSDASPLLTASDAPYRNASGTVATHDTAGAIDGTSLFFTSLGTNGRTCGTCHRLVDAMTVSPASVKLRFDATAGTDPLFRTEDGAVRPDADVSTLDARRTAYAMLLRYGAFRIGLPLPATRDFDLTATDDPYHYAGPDELSLFRRPLPATNLRFGTSVMWDGREPDLASQANDATIGHAERATPLTTAQRTAIVSFETKLYSAQLTDTAAGALDTGGATGGPIALSTQPFSVGINDAFGPTFNRNVFTIYDGWRTATPARAAVARGEAIFNARQFPITVRGLTPPGAPPIIGTCGTCHDAPNAGTHSRQLFIDLGLAAPVRRTPDQPLYTLRNRSNGAIVLTTDPGRALISGRFADVSAFKVPTLRALVAHAPYFHNGSAFTLDDVVGFYDRRFDLRLSPAEHADLVAFLRTL